MGNLNQVSKSQINLVNEYKGNLFEYLVAIEIAREFKLLDDFTSNITKEYLDQLYLYRNELNRIDPILYKSLPSLSKDLANEIVQDIFKKQIDVSGIRLIGKDINFKKSDFGETDILLLSKQNNSHYPLSIKFSKFNSFVNTKSGGIKSFLSNYFSEFDNEGLDQQEINHNLFINFELMKNDLFDKIDMPDMEVVNFENTWSELGHSSLPGELPKELRAIVLNFYSEMIKLVRSNLKTYHNQDRTLFKKCLMRLLGYERSDIIQAKCFTKTNNNTIELSNIDIHDYDSLYDKFANLKFKPYSKGLSSFEILGDKVVLQIRLKPMNKFTVPALKVNCSTKYLK